MRTITCVLATLVAACGGAAGTTDAGVDASMDAGRRDAGASDAGASDAGASDAGAIADAAPGDAERLDAASDDAGLDCSVIGCGPPTVCGETCDAPCGCCACSEGEEVMLGGEPYVCAGGCYARRGSGGTGSTCASTADCGAGLSCCYPCGIPGCENVCEPTCAPGTPECAGGCLLRP